MNTKAKPVLVIPTALDGATVNQLRSAGYAVIKCDNPQNVKLLSAEFSYDANDLLMSLFHGMSLPESSRERSLAMQELHRRLKEKESKFPT